MQSEPWSKIFAAGAFALAALPAAPALAAPACDVAGLRSIAPPGVEITSAERLDAPVAHCKVLGKAQARAPDSLINFTLSLPLQGWNGRYYFMGLGGSAGSMPPPPPKIIGAGFAVAVTDTGRQGSSADWSFLNNPVTALDHTHRGGHVATVAAQAITKSYYGVDKIWRYHAGCSGGGRMGLEAIQKHPGDYDGVLMGEAGLRSRPIGSGTMLKFIQMAQQANREPGAWPSPAKLKMAEAKITAACDAADGAMDQLVWDHRTCKFDVAKLQCKAGDAPDCLTGPEIKTIKAILSGPHGPKGELLSEPMPITNISTWSSFMGSAPPPWSPEAVPANMPKTSSGYVFATTFAHALMRPDYDVLKDFDFNDQKTIDAWRAASERIGFNLPLTHDLRPFEAAGGKVLMWGGVSSACCSNVEMEQWTDDVTRFMSGDSARVARFMQHYDIPGMGHCGGGTGPEDAPDLLLQTLIDWVEKGQAPGPVVVHRGERAKAAQATMKTTAETGVPVPAASGESRDFLLCPRPQVSVFDRSKAKVPGAVYDAANWSCRRSRA